MNTAIRSQELASRGPLLPRWLGDLVAGVRWGLEMRRRYDLETSGGRRPDEATIRRMAGEGDDWLGRRI